MYAEDIYSHLIIKTNQIRHLENSLQESNSKINQLNKKLIQYMEKFPDSSSYTNNS